MTAADPRIRIPGNSGCRLELMLEGEAVVRKACQSPAYAPRLAAQRRKQQAYWARPFPGVVIPRVLRHGQDWYEMEYLRMIDCIRFFERASPKLVERRIAILLAFVSDALRRCTVVRLGYDVMAAKLDDIRTRLDAGVWNHFYEPYERVVLGLARDGLEIAVGECHGDLTFSNVLFSFEHEQIGVIDFLDSFIDAPMIDVVKLRQDTRFHWTSMKYPHAHDRPKIRLTNRWIDDMVTCAFGRLLEEPAFQAVEMTNYLRIAPYVTDTAGHEWLHRALEAQTSSLACD